jgi:hypothetical protein
MENQELASRQAVTGDIVPAPVVQPDRGQRSLCKGCQEKIRLDRRIEVLSQDLAHCVSLTLDTFDLSFRNLERKTGGSRKLCSAAKRYSKNRFAARRTRCSTILPADQTKWFRKPPLFLCSGFVTTKIFPVCSRLVAAIFREAGVWSTE